MTEKRKKDNRVRLAVGATVMEEAELICQYWDASIERVLFADIVLLIRERAAKVPPTFVMNQKK